MELRCELEASIQHDLRHLHKEMPITSDLSIPDIRGIMLLRSIFKKFKDDTSSNADDAAIKMFLQMNARCKGFRPEPTDLFEALVLEEVRSRFWSMFSELSWHSHLPNIDEILDLGGVGPGANIGVKCYNFYTKLFDSDLTHSNDTLYRRYKSWTSRRSPTVDHAEISRELNWGHRKVEGSTTSVVPKNVDISRTICTEPVLNMFFQKGIGRLLEAVLEREFDITLSTQPDKNRSMARLGSVDGNFCTIDLKSASDTIALTMLESICPNRFFELLQLTRSPSTKVGNENIELWMVSSMGNGFTFPLQTLLFATVVEAVYKTLDIPIKVNGLRQYSVFGDDIIVVRRSYHSILRALKLFGFIVNDDKSFSSGNFRESCGHDYYNGFNVRGYYCKSLQHQANINATYNGLYEWQLKSGIILEETTRLLKKFQRSLIPMYEDPEAGYYCVQPPRRYKALIRVPKSFKVCKLPYRFHYNGDGLLRAFAGGYITNGQVTLRSDKPIFRIVSKYFGGNHLCDPVVSTDGFKHPWISAFFYAGRLRNQLTLTDLWSVGQILDNI